MVLAEDKSDPAGDFKSAVLALRALTETDLDAVNDTIINQMQSPVRMIPEVAGHLINAGGKRLRPVMTLASANIFDYQGDNHIRLAAAVELIHGATLLHDDVVDESKVRRGETTANEIWGNKESVLVGDFIFSRSFELMVETDNLEVLGILSKASGIIAEGEVLQLSTQHNVDATFDMYIAVVKAKTAALFAAACQVGGVIAKADPAHAQALYEYGLNLGIAYQIVDDALDYTGTTSTLGKSTGDDFREGKMTLPVVQAISMVRSDDEKAFWNRVMANGDIHDGDFEHAVSLMARDDIIARSMDCARKFADLAVQNLATLPSNHYTQAMIEVADHSVSRLS